MCRFFFIRNLCIMHLVIDRLLELQEKSNEKLKFLCHLSQFGGNTFVLKGYKIVHYSMFYELKSQ